MKGTLTIVVCLLLVFTASSQTNHIRFYREDIHFKIEDNIYTVHGLFFFENTGTNSMVKILRFPFPEDPLRFGKVLSFGIHDDTDGDEHILLKQDDSEAKFKIDLDAGQKKRYRINYKQEFTGKVIAFTTHKLGKAFDQFNFWLEMPAELELTEVSYEPDSTFVRENKRFYRWQRKDFMPEKNLIFKF